METKVIQASLRNYVPLVQVAKLTGVKEGSLRRWIRLGILKGFKNTGGTIYYFHKDQIDEIKRMSLPSEIEVDGCESYKSEDEVIPVTDVPKLNNSSATPHSLQEELLGLSNEAKLLLGEKIVEALFDLIK